MEVNLDKRYPLDVDAARAWLVLRDVPKVASCMPGAAITEQIDPTHYKGAVKVKVGPATAAFGGEIEVRQLDEASHTVQLFGKGADRSGSSASMDLTAHVEPGDTPGTAILVGNAAVIVNGKFAQFGGRMMVQVADMLLAQFADNFRAEAAALPAPAGAEAAGVAVEPAHAAGGAAGLVASASAAVDAAMHSALEGAAGALHGVEAAAVEVLSAASAGASAATATASAAASGMAAGAGGALHAAADRLQAATGSAAASLNAAARPAQGASSDVPVRKSNEINALALLWGLIKAWVAGLFGRKT